MRICFGTGFLGLIYSTSSFLWSVLSVDSVIWPQSHMSINLIYDRNELSINQQGTILHIHIYCISMILCGGRFCWRHPTES